MITDMFEQVDVRNVDKNTLTDVSKINIDTSLPVSERIENFVNQVKNPYCYKDGGLVIGIAYEDTDITLRDRLAVSANV